MQNSALTSLAARANVRPPVPLPYFQEQLQEVGQLADGLSYLLEGFGAAFEYDDMRTELATLKYWVEHYSSLSPETGTVPENYEVWLKDVYDRLRLATYDHLRLTTEELVRIEYEGNSATDQDYKAYIDKLSADRRQAGKIIADIENLLNTLEGTQKVPAWWSMASSRSTSVGKS